eukprot:scaffold294451_cov28-Tisochrysis_lutea.AAC.2
MSTVAHRLDNGRGVSAGPRLDVARQGCNFRRARDCVGAQHRNRPRSASGSNLVTMSFPWGNIMRAPRRVDCDARGSMTGATASTATQLRRRCAACFRSAASASSLRHGDVRRHLATAAIGA